MQAVQEEPHQLLGILLIITKKRIEEGREEEKKGKGRKRIRQTCEKKRRKEKEKVRLDKEVRKDKKR